MRPEYFYLPVKDKKSYTVRIQQFVPTVYDIAKNAVLDRDKVANAWCTYRLVNEDGEILYDRVTNQTRSFTLFEGKYYLKVIYTRFYNPIFADEFQTTYEIEVNGSDLIYELVFKPKVVLIKCSVEEYNVDVLADVRAYTIPDPRDYEEARNIDYDNIGYFYKKEYVCDGREIAYETFYTLPKYEVETDMSGYGVIYKPMLLAGSSGMKRGSCHVIYHVGSADPSFDNDYGEQYSTIDIFEKFRIDEVGVLYKNGDYIKFNMVPVDEIDRIILQYTQEDIQRIQFGSIFYIGEWAHTNASPSLINLPEILGMSSLSTSYLTMSSTEGWQNIPYDPERVDVIYKRYNNLKIRYAGKNVVWDIDQNHIIDLPIGNAYGEDYLKLYEKDHNINGIIKTPGRFYIDPILDNYLRTERSYFNSVSFKIVNSDLDPNNIVLWTTHTYYNNNLYGASMLCCEWYAEDY